MQQEETERRDRQRARQMEKEEGEKRERERVQWLEVEKMRMKRRVVDEYVGQSPLEDIY